MFYRGVGLGLNRGAGDSIKALDIDVPPCSKGLGMREPTIKINKNQHHCSLSVFLKIGTS